MESQNNTEHNVVGKTKKSITQSSKNKKQAAKIDSEIVAEMSSDSDGQKFKKTNLKQIGLGLELELNLKTKSSKF